MLKELGYDTLDALIDAAVPGSVRSLGTLDLPAARLRTCQVLAELRTWPTATCRRADDRPGLLGHRHAGRHPAQRAREPGLVHGLHAVPTRDQPGPAGGAAQLPDHGGGPHRARYGQRLAARREHRGGRGRHPHATTFQGRSRTASSSTPTACPRPSPCSRPDWPPWGSSSRSPTSTPGCPRAPCFGVVQQYPGCSGAIRDFAGVTAEAHAARRAGDRRRRPAGSDAADAARRAGGPTSSSARPSASAYRSGTAAPTPPSWRSKPASNGTCPVAWSASPSTPRAGPPTGWPCRHASSTSGARRPPRTSAPPRCCWPSSPPCTPCTTGPRGCAASPAGCTRARPSWRMRSSGRASGWSTVISSTRWSCTRPAGRPRSWLTRVERGVLLRLVDDDHVGISCGETTTSAHVAAVVAAFGAGSAGGNGGANEAIAGTEGHGGGAQRRSALPEALLRRGPILVHPVFSEHRLRDGHVALPAPPLGPRLRARPGHDPARVRAP